MKIQTLLAVPCEPPVAMAKALATLDWLSGGRSVPTLLTGYLEWEFEFLGVPYEERGAIMDEHVAAMIELWTADEPRFDGKYVQFANIAFEPKPRQNPLPLWFGGRTKAALGRIARYGSGWMSYATPHREMRDAIAYIESRPDFAAHPRTLEVSAYFVEATHDPVTHAERGGRKIIVGNDHVLTQLQYLTSIGVDVTGAPLDAMADAGGRRRPIASVTDYLERLAWFAEEIMPHARPLVAERS
jgi:alkanesulfonate monooxygenase SsuD/methylene tetrahydromethanopterin reductase-like flavin-dependent oxidoreductase (luciferase family)